MTTFTWLIEWMNAYPEHQGEPNVVISAGWRLNGVDSDYTATAYSSASFTLDPETPFTPYADLTQDQVLGWVWASGVDKDATEASVQQQIDNLKNPPIIQPPLPWIVQ